MNQIKLGQYVYGESSIHLLDPRTKIICSLLLILTVLINFNIYYQVLLLFLLAGIIAGSGIEFQPVLHGLRKIRYLLLVLFVFQAFLTPGDPVFQAGFLVITREGLFLGVVNLLRLVSLFLTSTILLMTTSPLKLTSGIEYLLLPLEKCRIPVHNFSMVVGLTFRFIPTLIEEANTIRNAQAARGARFNSPKIGERIKSYATILIPLTVSSLIRAGELAEAMDSRGYMSRTNLKRRSKINFQDVLALFIAMSLSAAGILMGFVPSV